MLRVFDWRDVNLVRVLSGQGVCLDAEIGLTQGYHPLHSALRAYLMPRGRQAPALVWRADTPSGEKGHPAIVGQVRLCAGNEPARLLFIAPHLTTPPGNLTTSGWLCLLEQMAIQAGNYGAQNLIAEVEENSAEGEALRAAGFVIYARQRLWWLDSSHHLSGDAHPAIYLRPMRDADVIGIQALYANVVPRLVQQVEPPPAAIERGYVLESGGEIVAFINLRCGPQGILIQPLLHPEVYDLSAAILQALLASLMPERKKLYLCARRYQDWSSEVVAAAGFKPLSTQTVMVKRLAVVAVEPRRQPLPVMNGRAATSLTSTRC